VYSCDDTGVRIHYGVNVHRQGHVCRVAEMLRRLRARGHHVTVSTCGPTPPAYTRSLLGDFEHVRGPGLAMRDGRLDPVRTIAELATTFPGCVLAAAALARRLVRERVDLVLSDFDLLSAWASGLARIPSAGVAGQYRVHRTRGPAPGLRTLHLTSFPVLEGAAIGLSRIFAISFCPVQSTRADTEVIGPIVDAEIVAAAPRRDGFTLVYVTAPTARVVAALAPSGRRFRVYGGHHPERIGNVELVATDRASFLDDLVRCDAVILNGGFQSVCEAAVLGKPILSIPIPQQYESLFNAHQLAASGLGIAAPVLDPTSVARLLDLPPPTRPAFTDGGAEVITRLGL
jgi:uncharacterized protein (TIGR00661 family)